MEKWKTMEAALDFAIAREIESRDFYMDLASRMENRAMADVFGDFASEEEGHRRKLERIKSGDYEEVAQGEEDVRDLKIADYVVEVEPSPEMDYGDALVLAMKKEKAAFRLYSDLAENVRSHSLKDLFGMLAREEAKHKLRFELEYDSSILTEN